MELARSAPKFEPKQERQQQGPATGTSKPATESSEPFQFEWFTSAELADRNEQVEYLVDSVVTKRRAASSRGCSRR